MEDVSAGKSENPGTRFLFQVYSRIRTRADVVFVDDGDGIEIAAGMHQHSQVAVITINSPAEIRKSSVAVTYRVDQQTRQRTIYSSQTRRYALGIFSSLRSDHWRTSDRRGTREEH